VRILFLSAWFPHPPDNGSKLRVYYLLRAMGIRHEVTLLSFAFGTAKPDEAADLGLFGGQIHSVPLNPITENRAASFRRFVSMTPIFARPVPEMSRRCQEILAGSDFDALIASTETMSSYAMLAPRSATTILEEHNSLTRWMWERYSRQPNAIQKLRCWVSWKKARHFESVLFSRFDLVTQVSELDRQVYASGVPGRGRLVEVIPNGVDCTHNHPGLTTPHPSVLVFNGSLTYSANYDAMQWFLAQVYPAIKQRVPQVSLSITGSVQGIDCGGLAFDPSVLLTGYVADVRQPVSEAAVCIAPIRQGSGTRLKILEAMALGTPVVATRKGAEGLDVVDGEHLLLADDAVTFGSHVVALLQTQALRARLSANARRLVEERYDWAQIGGQFVSLIEKVAAKRERAT
jgi:polysaccharide biosynthesis protein PslH